MEKSHLFIIPAVLLLFSSLVTAQQPNKTFVIGVEDIDYSPLYNFSEMPKIKPSFTYELFSTFFEKYHYKYQFVALPIKRFDQWFVDKNIDFKFPDNQRWRTNHNIKLNVQYSLPVMKLVAGTFTTKRDASRFKRDDIHKLGTIYGFYPSLWMDKISSKETQLIQVTTPLSLVKHLLHRNVDGINIDKNVINHVLKKMGKEGQVVLDKQIHHETYYYHFSTINHPKILAQFNDFITNNSEFIRSLKEKYHIDENF